MNIIHTKTLSLPDWLVQNDYHNTRLTDQEEQMEFVLSLARNNILNQTGGPFGAAVFDSDSGALISVGVNLVVTQNCAPAHAEVTALMLAQEKLKNYHLHEKHILVSSAQPCVMCSGALLWSGVKTLIYGASKEDVESITGFDEGPLSKNWRDDFARRGIKLIEKVKHQEAVEVLKLYKEAGGIIY